MCESPKIDKDDPNRTLEKMEQADDNRINCRQESEDPRKDESKILIPEPRFANP